MSTRYEQKRPATATASTTKVLNTYIRILTSKLRFAKRYRRNVFFSLLFSSISSLCASKRCCYQTLFRWLCLKLANTDKWAYLRVFWHNFANFMWKHKNMHGGAFTKSYRRTFFHEQIANLCSVYTRVHLNRPKFNFNGNVCNFVWLVWNCNFSAIRFFCLFHLRIKWM